MLLTVGVRMDASTVVLAVRRGTSKSVHPFARDFLRNTRHPNVFLWDILRLAFHRTGQGEPAPLWQEFTTLVSAIARSVDVIEATLVRQKEEAT